MKLFFKSKDGGQDSNVTGYWLIEWKKVFSIVLLRFDRGSREAFHSHAFNAWSWVLIGELLEVFPSISVFYGFDNNINPSWKPLFTGRSRIHKVYGVADKTWVLSFRGPWADTWKEYLPDDGKEVTLSSGRKIVEG